MENVALIEWNARAIAGFLYAHHVNFCVAANCRCSPSLGSTSRQYEDQAYAAEEPLRRRI